MTIYDTNTYQDDLSIDLSTVEAADDFAPIPPGDYQMQAVEVGIGFSQAGNRMVKAQYQVIGGEHDNRRIFESFNIEHNNPKVVEIALRSIKSWTIACGFTGNERLTMGMLKELEGREFLGKVKVEEDKTGRYSPSNRIRSYAPLPGSAPVRPAPAAPSKEGVSAYREATGGRAAQPPRPQPGRSQQPWERRV